MKRGMRCSGQKRRRFLGGRRSREARKSAGTSTESARAKRSSQEPGLGERMTSPDSGSLRMKTSREVKRKSEGKRTAWLRPFLKSLAILRMAASPGIQVQNRSEEHTSELQSQSNLVCRLLLE